MLRILFFVSTCLLWTLLGGTPVLASSQEYSSLSNINTETTSALSQEVENQILALEVQYDIALAEKNFENVAVYLREIGLYYLAENQLKRAEGYVWRSKIVSEKNGLLRQDLQSTAMLSKISMQLGLNRDAVEFQEEYLDILARISEEAEQNSSILDETDSQVGVADVKSVEETKSEFPVSVALTIMSLVVVLVLLWHFQSSFPENRNENSSLLRGRENSSSIPGFHEPQSTRNNVRETSAKTYENTLSDIDINMESVNIPDADEIESPVVEVKPVSKTLNEPQVISNANSGVSEKPKSKPITAEDVVRARGPLFDEFKETPKVPLWVSGIEHHFQSLNSFRGIRFDFNYSGDFSGVEESVYVTFTDFIRSFCDDIVESENVKSVSTLLVKTSAGLVFQSVISPVDPTLKAIPEEVIHFYEREFQSHKDCQVAYSTHYNGDQKMVLKSVSRESILVS